MQARVYGRDSLESVNALVEERCAKVDHWKNSSQRQRWLATALVDIEPRLRKVVGYRHLPKLRETLKRERRCCTARSKSLTSLCRLQSHPAQYVSGIPSAAILLSISHPIRCSTRCLANVRARISGPMIAL